VSWDFLLLHAQDIKSLLDMSRRIRILGKILISLHSNITMSNRSYQFELLNGNLLAGCSATARAARRSTVLDRLEMR